MDGFFFKMLNPKPPLAYVVMEYVQGGGGQHFFTSQKMFAAPPPDRWNAKTR